jgi:hypothetical protein
LRVTGGERIELEAGRYLGSLSPMDRDSVEVNMVTLDPTPEP